MYYMKLLFTYLALISYFFPIFASTKQWGNYVPTVSFFKKQKSKNRKTLVNILFLKNQEIPWHQMVEQEDPSSIHAKNTDLRKIYGLKLLLELQKPVKKSQDPTQAQSQEKGYWNGNKNNFNHVSSSLKLASSELGGQLQLAASSLGGKEKRRTYMTLYVQRPEEST